MENELIQPWPEAIAEADAIIARNSTFRIVEMILCGTFYTFIDFCFGILKLCFGIIRFCFCMLIFCFRIVGVSLHRTMDSFVSLFAHLVSGDHERFEFVVLALLILVSLLVPVLVHVLVPHLEAKNNLEFEKARLQEERARLREERARLREQYAHTEAMAKLQYAQELGLRGLDIPHAEPSA